MKHLISNLTGGRLRRLGLAVLCCTLLSFGCSKQNETASPPEPPVVETTVTGISGNTAQCGGVVSPGSGVTITDKMICWSLHPEPALSDTFVSGGAGPGSFSGQITFLIPDTVYYIKAYAYYTIQGSTSSLIYSTGGKTMTLRTPGLVIDSVHDVDGNHYPVVKIGDQLWLNINLRVTRYRNGDAIQKVITDNQWKTLTSGAYCFYDNQKGNDSIYGNLYNWFALTDTRGLCPTGWHVPDISEWAKLSIFLGGYDVAGGVLKSTGTIEKSTGLWFEPNTGATNSFGFSGLPGGYRINYGTYYSMGNVGYFWSSSDTAAVNGWNFVLDANNTKLNRNYNLKANGFSVRCCKD